MTIKNFRESGKSRIKQVAKETSRNEAMLRANAKTTREMTSTSFLVNRTRKSRFAMKWTTVKSAKPCGHPGPNGANATASAEKKEDVTALVIARSKAKRRGANAKS